MPLTITGDRFETLIAGIERKLDSPDLIIELGESLAGHLKDGFAASGLQSRSGATIAALTYVGQPESSGTGWSIGVGDANAAGSESDSPPRGVLKAFQQDNSLRPSPWKDMPQTYKDKLESLRRSGMYGGRGPMYANYLWVQDRGSAEAYISGHNYLDPAVAAWRQEVPSIINGYLNVT
jgi:hypothetical protein